MWKKISDVLTGFEISILLISLVTYFLGFFIDFYQLNPDPWYPSRPYIIPWMILFSIFVITSKLIKDTIDKDIDIVQYIIASCLRGIAALCLIVYFIFFLALLHITRF